MPSSGSGGARRLGGDRLGDAAKKIIGGAVGGGDPDGDRRHGEEVEEQAPEAANPRQARPAPCPFLAARLPAEAIGFRTRFLSGRKGWRGLRAQACPEHFPFAPPVVEERPNQKQVRYTRSSMGTWNAGIVPVTPSRRTARSSSTS